LPYIAASLTRVEQIRGHTAELSHKLIAYVPLAVVLIGALLSCCVMIFFCWPVEKAWTPDMDGKCFNPSILNVVGKSVSGTYNRVVNFLG
jgi:hypothetical protein